jgi:hypothetical protein
LGSAFVPGAVVVASLHLQPGCTIISEAPTALQLVDIRVIVVGTVQTRRSSDSVSIEPELFLKGAASREPIQLQPPDPGEACDPALLNDGDRVLLFLQSSDNRLVWPSDGYMFLLYEGLATNNGNTLITLTEVELVQNLRQITGQYAVPAETSAEGARIDWVGTVLPVGGGLVVILVISLALMGLWHRIDPS